MTIVLHELTLERIFCPVVSVTTEGAWIAEFLVDDVPSGLPVAEAVPQEPTAVLPRPTTLPIASSIIADFPSLLGLNISAAEGVLGDAEDIISLFPGDMLGYDGGGQARDYDFGNFSIYGFYDESDKLRGLQVY
jgi:hypothetical protein